tara:strand:+ start:39 stop:815 length:777 start_codon:yes stop_codon:yes gene_type:complete
MVKKGDVILGSVITTSSKTGSDTITDVSRVIQKGEEGYIDDVSIRIAPNGYKIIKIKIRKTKNPEVGDKVAARSAQKGTIGMIYSQEDMPFTCGKNSVVPDIVINALCIPSRMTINQLIECVLGKRCCMDGTDGDCTPFTEFSKNVAKKVVTSKLTEYGYQSNGNERMYNGMTGELLDAEVFIGPTYYQRLKHQVSNKMHARATGRYTTMTRQPLGGRSNDGGLRFGKLCQKASVKTLLILGVEGNISKLRGNPKVSN